MVLVSALAQHPAAHADGSTAAVQRLAALFAASGVLLRAPESCIDADRRPSDDPDVVRFCAVKDVFGALGGPSSGAAATQFIPAPNRFAFDQPVDCAAVGPVADGKHDGCAVLTGAATLLRSGLPVRLFGVCARPAAQDCAVRGTISDPEWRPDGVYLLMDPARVTVRCQYAQDAGRNGCDENGAYTAGRYRPRCTADPADPTCEYPADERDRMLAAYADYCTREPATCSENQVEAQWDPGAVVAVGYLNRIDRGSDCATARAKAATFAAAVNAEWSTGLPLVRVDADVAHNTLVFTDDAAGCGAHSG